MNNPYIGVLDYAYANGVGVIVPTYVDYLKCQNYVKLYKVLPNSINIVTYTSYKTLLHGNDYVCLVNTQSDYKLMSKYKFRKYMKGNKLVKYLITNHDADYVNNTVDIDNINDVININNIIKNNILDVSSNGDNSDSNADDKIVLTTGISRLSRFVLPLQLALAEQSLKQISGSSSESSLKHILEEQLSHELDRQSLTYISCLGLNRLLPLLNLPDFINTLCYTDFEQTLFYFWRLVSATRSATNAFTTESVDATLIRSFHQNNDVLLFVPYFELSTGIKLQNIEVSMNITLSTISEIAKQIAKFYWPYCYILRKQGTIFIEMSSGSSISVADEVQQYEMLACLDIDWDTHTARYTLPYFES
jgi:hypothetical protein